MKCYKNMLVVCAVLRITVVYYFELSVYVVVNIVTVIPKICPTINYCIHYGFRLSSTVIINERSKGELQSFIKHRYKVFCPAYIQIYVWVSIIILQFSVKQSSIVFI